MKYLRVTAEPDLDAAPRVLRLLLASPQVTAARLLSWNFGESRGILTGLFAVEGDHEAFTAALDDPPELVEADVTPDGPDRFYLLLSVRPASAPLLGDIAETLFALDLLVITPVLYRDGKVHARFVGRSETVQAVLDGLPPAIRVDVREVGERGFERGAAAAALSERQREALQAAFDLGYYELPRQVTHADVADRLGCAPSTASEHLQKAEAKLVRATMAESTFAGSGSRAPAAGSGDESADRTP